MGYIYDGKLGVTHRCKVYLQFLVSKRLPFMFEDWFQESYFNTDIYNSHTSINKDLAVLFFVNLLLVSLVFLFSPFLLPFFVSFSVLSVLPLVFLRFF